MYTIHTLAERQTNITRHRASTSTHWGTDRHTDKHTDERDQYTFRVVYHAKYKNGYFLLVW